MSGRFRLIYLGDISRDDHLEFTFLSNLIKKNNLNAKIFVRIIFLNHHNNVQMQKFSSSKKFKS